MHYVFTWAMVIVGLWTSSASAQMGGFGMMSGGMGEGGMEAEMGGFGGGYGGGFGAEGYGYGEPGGIRAYSDTATEGGKFQVIWTGPEAAQSQELYERLTHEESKVQFIDTPLEEVVDYLKDVHNVSILLDQDTLENKNISNDLAITANISGLSASTTLDLLCSRYKLGWYVDQGVLMITTKEDASQHQTIRIYKLHQLRASGADQIITKMVQPDSWVEAGGNADVVTISDRQMLVIRQNRVAHDEIESLLKTLESAK